MSNSATIANSSPSRRRDEEVMRLLARIVTNGTAAMLGMDENSLRQTGYAASLVRGRLEDPEDNLGAAIRLAIEALDGKTATATEFRDPVQAKWGAPRHLSAAKLRLETPLLLPRIAAGRAILMTAGRSLPKELVEHLSELSRRLGPLAEPLHAWLAGGFAVQFHTQHRMSCDVDIKWSRKVPIPPDLQIFEISAPEAPGGTNVVVMDGSFGDAFESFPPEWEQRSKEVHRFGDMVLHVIDPVDLAVSKVARFSDRDREDIQAFAERGLVDPDLFARRAEEALVLYVGDLTFVRRNLADAMQIVSAVEHQPAGIGEALVPNSDESDDDSAVPDPFAITDRLEPPRES